MDAKDNIKELFQDRLSGFSSDVMSDSGNTERLWAGVKSQIEIGRMSGGNSIGQEKPSTGMSSQRSLARQINALVNTPFKVTTLLLYTLCVVAITIYSTSDVNKSATAGQVLINKEEPNISADKQIGEDLIGTPSIMIKENSEQVPIDLKRSVGDRSKERSNSEFKSNVVNHENQSMVNIEEAEGFHEKTLVESELPLKSDNSSMKSSNGAMKESTSDSIKAEPEESIQKEPNIKESAFSPAFSRNDTLEVEKQEVLNNEGKDSSEPVIIRNTVVKKVVRKRK